MVAKICVAIRIATNTNLQKHRTRKELRNRRAAVPADSIETQFQVLGRGPNIAVDIERGKDPAQQDEKIGRREFIHRNSDARFRSRPCHTNKLFTSYKAHPLMPALV